MPSYTSFGSAATAWCFVWFPALFYLLYTRYPSASHAGVSSEHVQLWQASECAALSAVLYADRYACADSGSRTERYLALQQALQLLWHADERTYQESLESNVPPVLLLDSTWHTDANGVSALLLAQVSDDGRLWQWHTGGGPIPIGRTLVMDQAGCRSAACDRSNGPLRGVGGLSTAPTTTSSSNTDNDATLLVVAEWGERRIVRVEENGARTPLVIQVPSVEACQSSTSTTNRLHAPRHVTVTPQHDLFFVDSVAVGDVPSHHNDAAPPPQDCFVVWHQARVDRIPALPTLADSRRAHTWTALPYHQPLLVPVYTSPTPIGGLAVVQDAVTLSSSLYVTTAWPAQGVVVLEISLDDDSTDEMISTTAETDDDDDTATTHEPPVSPTTKAPRVLFRLQRHLPNALEPGPLVVTAQRTIFLGTNEGLAILLPNYFDDDTDGRLVDYRLAGLLPLAIMDRPRITSLTLGGDGYLYVTTESRLWRLKIRDDSL